MFAYCNNNPVNCSDPSGMSSHYCCDPTCFKCRPERRDFVNDEERLDWYNSITGSNILGVDYKGEFIYSTPIVIDTSTLEYKVLRTIGISIESFEISGDFGLGFSYMENLFKALFVDVSLLTAVYGRISINDGIDVGIKSGSMFSLTVCDIGPDAGVYYNHSWITGETKIVSGVDNIIGYSIGRYVLGGASISAGFNYDYILNEARKVW